MDAPHPTANGSTKKSTTKVQGILKHGSGARSRGGVRWDEDNLIFNESLQTATMRIDEPPTPYNHEYDPAEDDTDDEEETDAVPQAQADNNSSSSNNKEAEASSGHKRKSK